MGRWRADGVLMVSDGVLATRHWDMKGLADYLHAKRLKLGFYVTGGMAAVYKHEDAWADMMFNVWGGDSVKVDHMCANVCETAPGAINHPSDQIVPAFQEETIRRWAAAINKTGKTVLFNNCGIGCSPSEGVDSRDPRPWGEWCRELANTWRSSGDASVQSWHNNLESLIGRGSLYAPKIFRLSLYIFCFVGWFHFPCFFSHTN